MNRDGLTLGDFFYYDETSPSCLRWAVRVYNGDEGRRVMAEPGDVAGTAHNKAGYAVVGLLGVTWLVHKVIWAIVKRKSYKTFQIDHEDGDVKNNLISNLRETTQRANMQNRRISSANTSGVAGVDRCKRGKQDYWRARCYTVELAPCGTRGKERVKLFNVGKMGDAEAFKAACEYRSGMIKQLNGQGADYKERHGI